MLCSVLCTYHDHVFVNCGCGLIINWLINTINKKEASTNGMYSTWQGHRIPDNLVKDCTWYNIGSACTVQMLSGTPVTWHKSVDFIDSYGKPDFSCHFAGYPHIYNEV